MLNTLQKKQYDAVRSVLSRNTSELLSLDLFEAYLEHVDCSKFAASAVLFKRPNKTDLGISMRKVSLNCTAMDFFSRHREKIAKFFESLAEDHQGLFSSETTSIMVASDIATRGSIKQSPLVVTPHDAGLALYGVSSAGAKFQRIAEVTVIVISEVAAELFLKVASSIPGEPLVERDYFIPEFLNRVGDGDFSEFGLEIVKYTFDDVGAEIFVKNALTYKSNNGARKDGKLVNLDYIDGYIDFYDSNKLSIINWLNAHIESGKSEILVKGDLLNSIYKSIENFGLNSYGQKPIVSLHEIASIIYGNSKDNSAGYDVIAKTLMILVVEQISLEYQRYYNYLYQ